MVNTEEKNNYINKEHFHKTRPEKTEAMRTNLTQWKHTTENKDTIKLATVSALWPQGNKNYFIKLQRVQQLTFTDDSHMLYSTYIISSNTFIFTLE